jgi:hypothetical protein
MHVYQCANVRARIPVWEAGKLYGHFTVSRSFRSNGKNHARARRVLCRIMQTLKRVIALRTRRTNEDKEVQGKLKVEMRLRY